MYDHDVNFFIRRCLEGVSKFTMIEFFSPVGCGPEGFNSIEIHLFICPFEQVGINAQNFEKTRIRFNSDVLATRLPSIFVKPPHIQTVNSYYRRRKLSWFVGRIVYSKKNCGIKGIRNKYSLSISDSKSPETWPNRYVFYFLDSRISVQYVNVALSYESDWPASVNELKKATKIFKLLRDVISYTVKCKMLRLTVTLPLGILVGGGGKGEKVDVLLKTSWLSPWVTSAINKAASQHALQKSSLDKVLENLPSIFVPLSSYHQRICLTI